jgi:hypothetical protein
MAVVRPYSAEMPESRLQPVGSIDVQERWFPSVVAVRVDAPVPAIFGSDEC